MTDNSKGKTLVINLDTCDDCPSCELHCDYHYRPYSADHGMLGLREKATFELVCRRCEYASCVEACPFGAIERDGDKVLRRHNLRCVSCKLCAHACPFGTIYTEMLPFYVTHCSRCIDHQQEIPPCITSCSRGALEFIVPDPDEENLHIVDERLAARTVRWVRREVST